MPYNEATNSFAFSWLFSILVFIPKRSISSILLVFIPKRSISSALIMICYSDFMMTSSACWGVSLNLVDEGCELLNLISYSFGFFLVN